MIRVANDFRIGGPYNLLLVETGQSRARLVWLVDYDRWRDDGAPGAGEYGEISRAWALSVILFEATEENFDKLVRTDIFAECFTSKWKTREQWAATTYREKPTC